MCFVIKYKINNFIFLQFITKVEVIKLALKHSVKIVSEESLKKDFHIYLFFIW